MDFWFLKRPLKTSLTFDYIIVGQGLAGSCMVLQLLKQRKRILVIDQFNEHAATQVAAGLFNPVTGRKMSKTWKADELFPYLHEFYQEAERLTNQKFFHSMRLYRPFISVEEQNEWMGKSSNEELAKYIESVHVTPLETEMIKNPYGGLSLKQCGYLDTVTFSSAVRDHLRKHSMLLEEEFVEDELIINPEGVEYRKHRASKIIFCQGVEALTGKLFSWLPVRPLKGETLTIKTNIPISTIYNRGVYAVPGIWKVGATYQANDVTPAISEAARKELVEKLDELISFPYEVVTQSWGIRPTTPDRKPILGPHPEHSSVVIFNGLGTKGVSLAPYFSKVLAASLENGASINKEVDIERYKHYNYGGNILR